MTLTEGRAQSSADVESQEGKYTAMRYGVRSPTAFSSALGLSLWCLLGDQKDQCLPICPDWFFVNVTQSRVIWEGNSWSDFSIHAVMGSTRESQPSQYLRQTDRQACRASTWLMTDGRIQSTMGAITLGKRSRVV